LARPELSNDYAKDKNNWNNQHHAVYAQIAANATQASVENRLRSFIKKYNPPDDKFLKDRATSRMQKEILQACGYYLFPRCILSADR